MSIDLIAGHTYHGRKGGPDNGFRYAVDYVLFDAEAELRGPGIFSRNRFNLTSVHDRDHGGAPKQGRGAAWAREVLAAHDLQADRLMLLTQMRVLGYVFNPVSFWLAYEGTALRAVIAEVTNTFGDRHAYLCAKPDGTAIAATDTLSAQKVFHVSPFQPIDGAYRFRFDIGADRIGIHIELHHGKGGVIATLCGPRQPMTTGALLAVLLRRPLGARRVMALIHWQALKLWWKGAGYRDRPKPPAQEVSGHLTDPKGARA